MNCALWRSGVVAALLVSFVAIAALPAAASEPCARVVAVGDLHGGYDAFVMILEQSGLVDAELRWAGGSSCLVQTGDVVDRGDRSREILDLLMDLERQAPDRIHALLGNHEAMNLTGDLRYVAPGEFAAFTAEETDEDRERGFTRFAAWREDPADPGVLRQEFDALFPAGWFAHRRAFSPGGKYGRWLLSRPVAVRLGRTVYVHAGLSPELAALGLDEINRRTLDGLREYVARFHALVDAGILEPWDSPVAAFERLAGWLASPAAEGLEAEAEAARALWSLRDALFQHSSGPLWLRDLALADEGDYRPQLERTLELLDAERIVVGHTIPPSHRIASRFGHRVLQIDTGAGPAYPGPPSGLELLADGSGRALYVGSEVQVPSPEIAEEEQVAILKEGRIVEVADLGVGVTRPMKVTLEHGGRTWQAAFKTVDIHRRGVTRLAEGPPEIDFKDRWHFDVAAYLLDRRLGMGLVPTTVTREHRGERGALVWWVHGVVDEVARVREQLQLADPARFAHQIRIMHLFDALIGNTDRNTGNLLTGVLDGRVHLIDHTRSFRRSRALNPLFLEHPAGLTRPMLAALESLERDELVGLLRDLVDRPEIDALLRRRDRILEKVAADRAAFGDGMVFNEAVLPSAEAGGR
jgi:hypothetical protein